MVRNIVKRNETYRQDFLRNNKGVFGVYFCYLCNRPMTRSTMQVDHIMPISKLGGTNMRMNLAPLCPKCNRKKSNKIDHRVPIMYTRKIITSILIIPFKILGFCFETFLKLNWKLKVVIVGLAMIWAFRSGIISGLL